MAFQQIMGTHDMRVRIMELEPGAATEWHHHTAVSDFFVCLTGAIRIEARDPEQVLLLTPGARAEVAPPRVHRVVNLQDETTEYLLVQGVGGYDFIKEPV